MNFRKLSNFYIDRKFITFTKRPSDQEYAKTPKITQTIMFRLHEKWLNVKCRKVFVCVML